jgi:tetratricopeptide (TPR) repeat protein
VRHPSVASVLSACAALALAGCGGSSPAPAPAEGGGAAAPLGGGGGGSALGKKMPEFQPSGIKEDFRKLREAKDAIKNAKAKEEQEAAKAAADALKQELAAKWGAREVPAPEAHYLANILHDAGKSGEAVAHARRWLEIAPDDNLNYVHITTLLISCLAASGDYQGAQDELKATAETTYKGKDQARAEVLSTIAMYMLKNGKLDMAFENFETCMTTNMGDMESAILAVELAQRLGKPQEAVRIGQKAADFFKEGRQAERAKQLHQGVQLLGKAAPGFAAAKWWKGVGGPVTADMMKNRVTIVFSWNMKSAWNKFFFDRMHALLKETADKGVQMVGISRLARFDALKMGTRKDMTDDEELAFYDMWKDQYGVTYPFAVDGYDSEELMSAWAAYTVPFIVIVGKDGNVFAVLSGKDEERIAAVRELVDMALAK